MTASQHEAPITELEWAYLKIEELELALENIMEMHEAFISNPTQGNADILRHAFAATRKELKSRVLH